MRAAIASATRTQAETSRRWSNARSSRRALRRKEDRCTARRALSTGADTQIAIALDHQVISAPIIYAVINEDAYISGGDMDREGATLLAASLSHGAPPLRLVVESVETVR